MNLGRFAEFFLRGFVRIPRCPQSGRTGGFGSRRDRNLKPLRCFQSRPESIGGRFPVVIVSTIDNEDLNRCSHQYAGEKNERGEEEVFHKDLIGLPKLADEAIKLSGKDVYELGEV